jgi:hypothetical protein
MEVPLERVFWGEARQLRAAMKSRRRAMRIGAALPELLGGCPRCGEPPRSTVTVEVCYGQELRWLMPFAARRIRRAAARFGYEVREVYQGGPAGLPQRPMSGGESPEDRFLIVRLTRPVGIAGTVSTQEDAGIPTDVEEDEAAVIYWPWLHTHRRLLEWGGGQSRACACFRRLPFDVDP